MKNIYALLLALSIFNIGFSQKNTTTSNGVASKDAYAQLGNLPVTFRENVGQWNDTVLYQGFSPGWQANINFMKDGLSFGLSREDEAQKEEKTKEAGPKGHFADGVRPTERLVWNVYFKGMNPNVSISSEGPEDSHINYMTGNDASKYHINVPDYRVINYKNVYKNIDAKYYSTGKNIKYDFYVKPGGDIRNIQMNCQGIQHINVNQ